MFERYVTGKRRNWRRRALIVGSLALHGAAVATLVVAAWFHVAEVTPPALAVVFYSAPPPPPPPGVPRSRPPHLAGHRTQPAVATPTPATAPQPTEEPAGNDGPPDSEPGEGPPGGGGPPGAPTTCSGPGCIGAPAPKPRNLPPHALDAQRIGGAIPHLPAAVIGARHGLGDTTFSARLCVDTSGAISSVTVLAGIPGADADIVSALRGWRYKPQAIPVCFVTQLVYDVQ